MSRKRKPNSGDPRKRKPARAALKAADAYACGHCRSTTRGVTVDQHGVNHLHISHDDSCPVLNGAVSDEGDVIRAAVASGGPVVLILGGGWPE